MNRLEEQFGDDIQFFHLNVDFTETLPIRQEYGMTRRSQYQLLGPDGESLLSWFGPLSEDAIVLQLDDQLAKFEAN